MSDYQKMYGIMVRASEKAIRILIEAQRQCEERALKEENELIYSQRLIRMISRLYNSFFICVSV